MGSDDVGLRTVVHASALPEARAQLEARLRDVRAAEEAVARAVDERTTDVDAGRGASPKRKSRKAPWAASFFGANPSYELVLLDRLPPGEQAQIRLADPARDLYGAFCPRAGSGWNGAPPPATRPCCFSHC